MKSVNNIVFMLVKNIGPPDPDPLSDLGSRSLFRSGILIDFKMLGTRYVKN